MYSCIETGHIVNDWTHSLNLWCLNPSVVFKEVANLSRSVILTSGYGYLLNYFYFKIFRALD